MHTTRKNSRMGVLGIQGPLCLVILILLSACGSKSLQGTASTRVQTSGELTNNIGTPAQLVIPTIHVNAPIETVGLTNGNLATPMQAPWDDVGWYQLGPQPGDVGSAVIDGHLDRPGGAPAVFWNLRQLQIGDHITVIEQGRLQWHFHVTRVESYSPSAAPTQAIFGDRSGHYLNLITCAGVWIPSQHQTTLREVVYSTLDA